DHRQPRSPRVPPFAPVPPGPHPGPPHPHARGGGPTPPRRDPRPRPRQAGALALHHPRAPRHRPPRPAGRTARPRPGRGAREGRQGRLAVLHGRPRGRGRAGPPPHRKGPADRADLLRRRRLPIASERRARAGLGRQLALRLAHLRPGLPPRGAGPRGQRNRRGHHPHRHPADGFARPPAPRSRQAHHVALRV
ncbi:MAG: Nitroreductase family protein, partial [uncultured Rubellimicrobium sp.]